MNEVVKALYDADIFEHAQSYSHGSPDYLAMREGDRQRRERLEELIASDKLSVAADYFHAARIFQHGDSPEDAWQAHQLALKAVELGEPRGRWLAAAAYDRFLMYQGKPQKYGTQYVSDGKRQRLWDLDPQTSDEERAAWDVPALSEQIRKAEEASRLHPPTPIGEDAPQWLKDAILRWQLQEDDKP